MNTSTPVKYHGILPAINHLKKGNSICPWGSVPIAPLGGNKVYADGYAEWSTDYPQPLDSSTNASAGFVGWTCW